MKWRYISFVPNVMRNLRNGKWNPSRPCPCPPPALALPFIFDPSRSRFAQNFRVAEETLIWGSAPCSSKPCLSAKTPARERKKELPIKASAELGRGVRKMTRFREGERMVNSKMNLSLRIWCQPFEEHEGLHLLK